MPDLTDEQIKQAAQVLIDDLTAEWEKIAPKDVKESAGHDDDILPDPVPIDEELWRQCLAAARILSSGHDAQLAEFTAKLIDADAVKRSYEMDFLEGGNFRRYLFIPKGQIWLDKRLSAHDLAYDAYHEAIEARRMEHGEAYDAAHKYANTGERQLRREMRAEKALQGDSLPGGKADFRPDSDFDAAALAKGIKVEMEHTNDPKKAKEIAKDHLAERADYYERLAEVEESKEKPQLTAEDIDAIADIIGGIYGNDALKFFNEGKDVAESLVDVFEWEEAKHPRGKGGRFIEAHSAEARQTAHDEIEKILHGKKTPESHKKLVEHLSILSTKQLHEVRKRYGLKASGKLKQQLVDKLSDRLIHGNPEKKVKQPSNTLFKIIRSRGGIDVDALRKTHDVKQEFIESGLLGVLAGKDKDRRARGLDQWAKTLAEEGHVAFPPGSNPSEHLLSLLKQKALSLHDEREAEIAAEEKEYYQRMKEAQDAGIDQREIDEAIRSGEAAGVSEAEKGDAWEGPGELAYAKGDEVEPWDEPRKAKNVTHTPEFKSWFRGSKIVDSDGNPLKLFHGTADSIDEFDLEHPNRKDTGWLGTGVYMTTSSDIAGSYANLKSGRSGPQIMPLYARLENPYYATVQDKQRIQLISHNKGAKAGREASDIWTEELKKQGYDGVILDLPASKVGKSNASMEIVVFDPSGVKSASGNRGTFDPNSHNVNESGES